MVNFTIIMITIIIVIIRVVIKVNIVIDIVATIIVKEIVEIINTDSTTNIPCIDSCVFFTFRIGIDLIDYLIITKIH